MLTVLFAYSDMLPGGSGDKAVTCLQCGETLVSISQNDMESVALIVFWKSHVLGAR